MKLLYIANIRMPTEKAHGLQIMQNCEAFADAGTDVTLWAAGRVNTPELRKVDPFAYYGVNRIFALRRLPCIDLLPLVPGRTDIAGKLAFYLQQATFLLVMWSAVLFTQADVYYSRDMLALLLLSLVKPRESLVYEAHKFASSSRAQWVQQQVLNRVGTVITVTGRLADDLTLLAADSPDLRKRLLVAHDGIRRERFENMLSQLDARKALGWDESAFIVGYVGRLQTLTMDKGVGTLVEALKGIEGVSLALVGGPDEVANALREQWLKQGGDPMRFLYAGHVVPERVPTYLSALDVCAMPFPFTEHFAYYASPIKLFEYMASKRVIVASNLPSIAEILKHEQSALLVPPSDVNMLAAAIIRLRDDAALRETLATKAYEDVMARYTWAARAAAILSKVMSNE